MPALALIVVVLALVYYADTNGLEGEVLWSPYNQLRVLPVGADIDDYLEKNDMYFENTKIITNYFNFDKNGKVISAKEPIITTTNKYLAVNEFTSTFEGVNRKKKNILLLGDNYEDENMANGFFQEDIIKIGFLNEEIDERLDDYKRVFDVVILNDGKMDFVNNLLKELV